MQFLGKYNKCSQYSNLDTFHKSNCILYTYCSNQFNFFSFEMCDTQSSPKVLYVPTSAGVIYVSVVLFVFCFVFYLFFVGFLCWFVCLFCCRFVFLYVCFGHVRSISRDTRYNTQFKIYLYIYKGLVNNLHVLYVLAYLS